MTKFLKKVLVLAVAALLVCCLVSCALIAQKDDAEKQNQTENQTQSESNSPTQNETQTNDDEQGGGQGDEQPISDQPATDEPNTDQPNTDQPSGDQPNNDQTDGGNGGSQGETPAELKYEDLFDLNNKVAISIEIADEELAKFSDDYYCNTYRVADKVTFTVTKKDGTVLSEEVEDVGIRMKGNTSRDHFFDEGVIEKNVHFKLSFNETFDDEAEYKPEERKTFASSAERKARKDRTVFGLDGLELKFNREFDASYSREIYASEVYKRNGIYAQDITLGTLSFPNQQSASSVDALYKIYEPVDKYFVHHYFSEGMDDGDLYKASYGNAAGMPTLNHSSDSDVAFGVDKTIYKNEKEIAYDLKTNKKKSQHEKLKSFLSWINSEETDLSETLGQYMDEDYFYTFAAIQYLTGDWDNFLYDSNNYYLYFADNGKAYFIPYDMDRTFGIEAKTNAMALREITDSWNLQGFSNQSNLLLKTIFKDGSEAQAKYVAKVKELASGVLNFDLFKTTVYDVVFANYGEDFEIGLGNTPAEKNNAPESYFNQKALAVAA